MHIILSLGRTSRGRLFVFGRRPPHRGAFPYFLAYDSLLDGDFFTELFQRFLPFQLLEFSRCVLVQELINGQIPAAYSNVNLVLIHSDRNPFRPELIYALAFPHEHYLKLLSLRVVIDELRQTLVYRVVLHWNVHCYPLLQLNYVTL